MEVFPCSSAAGWTGDFSGEQDCTRNHPLHRWEQRLGVPKRRKQSQERYSTPVPAERRIAQFCSQGLRDPSENLPWYLKQQQTSPEMLVRLTLIHQKGSLWTGYKEREHFANKLIFAHAKHASVWKLGAPNSVTTKFHSDSKWHLLQKDHNWP